MANVRDYKYKKNEDDYAQSDDTKNAYAKLDTLKLPGEFKYSGQDQMNKAFDDIMNRKDFSYDVNADMLYQQYKDAATRNGNLAMQDTMGQAAAMTGGYGNSYAQQVGQQTYNGYMQQLNDKIPELYQLALDQYNREGQELKDLYALHADRYANEYGQYRDSVADYQNERAYLTDAARYSDQTGYSRWSDNAERRYRDYRDSVADDRYDTEYADNKAQQEWENQFRTDQYTDNKAQQEWENQFRTDQYTDNKAQQDKENQRYDDQQKEKTTEKNREKLYGLIGMGYTPSAQDLADAGMTEKEYSTVKSSYSEPTTQPKSIDAGSDAEAAIMAAFDGATSEAELANIVDRYAAQGYYRDTLISMSAGAASKLKNKKPSYWTGH